jgi:hypothetical protein
MGLGIVKSGNIGDKITKVTYNVKLKISRKNK